MARKTARSKAKRRRTLWILVGVALIVIAFAIFLLWFTWPKPTSDVLVTVNNDAITDKDLSFQYDLLPESYRQLFSRDQVLEQVVDEQLVVQAAKRDGVNVSQQQVHERVQSIVTSSGLTLQDLEQNLATYNITQEKFEELISRQMIIDVYLNKTLIAQPVDEAVVIAYYNASKEKFMVAAQVTVRHILIAAQRTNASLIAKSAYDDAKAGKDFCQLVQNLSDDRGSRDTCGQYTFPRGFMVPEFENASFAMKDGELRLVQTQFGQHIILKINSTPATLKPLAAVHDEIVAELQSAEHAKAYRALLSDLRAVATIRYANGTVILPAQQPTLAPAAPPEAPAAPNETLPQPEAQPTPTPQQPVSPPAPEPALPPQTAEPAPNATGLDLAASETASVLSCIAKVSTLYGTSWSTDTQSARTLFARTGVTLSYVQCDPDSAPCRAKGVVAYPTWRINNQPFLGAMSVEQLRNAAGC